LPATWRTAAAGIDLLTAVCAAVNLAYFCYRLSAHPPGTAPRRAALVLAVVSLGAVVESAALLAAAGRGAPVESLQWTLVRGLALAGASGMSAMVLRKIILG